MIVELIRRTKLSEQELAQQLYPNHKHPQMAYKRLVEGKSILEAVQLAKLVELAGGDLEQALMQHFQNQHWKSATSENGKLLLLRGVWVVEIDPVGVAQISNNADDRRATTVVYDTAAPVTKLIAKLNEICSEL